MPLSKEQIRRKNEMVEMVRNRVHVRDIHLKTGYAAATIKHVIRDIYGKDPVPEYPGCEKHYDSTHKNETLCWRCKKAVRGCSWSKRFVPIEGWKAEETTIRNNPNEPDKWVTSFHVIQCPEFEKDDPKRTANRWQYEQF